MALVQLAATNGRPRPTVPSVGLARVLGRAVGPSAGSAGRLTLVVTAIAIGMFTDTSGDASRKALTASALLVACLLLVAGPWATRPWRDESRRTLVATRVLVGLGVVVVAGQTVAFHPGGESSGVAMALVFLVAGLVAVVGHGRVRAVGFGLAVTTQLVVMVVLVHLGAPSGDVYLHLDGAVRDLLHGHSPYGGSIMNPYTAAETARYIAPEMVRGDTITVGFPYLPATIISDVPGWLVGDPRYSHVAAVLVMALVWWRLADDRTGKVLAVLAVASPLMIPVATAGWVEPPIMAALAVTALAVRRGWKARGALGVAFLLASKQYGVAALPFLLPVWRRLGTTAVAAGVALAGALCVGFFAWGPSGFWNDVVTYLPLQALRTDSVSLLVVISQELGPPPSWVTSVVPLVVGFVVSAFVAVRLRAGATASAASFALGLLATVLLSKVAFANYFALIQAGLVTAAIAWSGDVRDGSAEHDSPTPTEVGAAP
jgi:hypothetical protein